MQWTKGQEGLKELALERVARGVAVNIALCQDHSGVSRVVNALARHKSGSNEPRVIRVHAAYAWNVVVELCAQTNTSGRALSDCIRNSLKVLTQGGQRTLCILLEDSHLMSVKDVERLLLALENVIEMEDMCVRIVMLQRGVERWVEQTKTDKGGWKRGWASLPHFLKVREHFKSLHYFMMKRDGLDELRSRELPKEIFSASPEVRQAVAS